MITLNIEIDSNDYEKIINILRIRMSDFKKPLGKINLLMLRSFDLNFKEQGRPNKWIPSKSALARKGLTLVDTGRLRRSLSIKGSDNISKITKLQLIVGTSVEYAELHNFGGKFNAFNNPKFPRKMIARPFVLAQKEDIDNMFKILNEYLTA